MMYSGEELRYSLGVMKARVEQAYFDADFAGVAVANKLREQKTWRGLTWAFVSSLPYLHRVYKSARRTEKRYHKIQRMYEKAITKAAGK